MARRKKQTQNPIISLIIVIILLVGYTIAEPNTKDESYSNKETESSKSIKVNNIVTTDLQIHFLDVGQADSILITNNNHSMLIDAGNNEDGKKIVTYLENLGITSLDYVVGTHPHEDHIGGLDDVINNLSVKEIYLPEATTTTKTFEDVLDAIANKDLSLTVPTIGETFKLGEAEFEVIYTGTGTKDLNEASIILKMIFGNHTYLFTGDTIEEVEQTILSENINIDVLKVAHHGSKYSSCQEFLDIATPDYAIISAGEGNSYGHPEEETLNRLKQFTNKIYVTKDLGTIILSSNGSTIEIETKQTDTNG